jgi:tRNA-specific 2-thiouridylase
MSGGVDSAVAAAILVDEGHDVIGVTLRVLPCADDESDSSGGGRGRQCCAAGDVEDARRVAEAIGIPHYVIDVREQFRQDVMAPFISDYASGRTPVPCAPCNHAVKFGSLLERALALEAEAVATGHYARIDHGFAGPRLLRAVDGSRDQTYFLYGVARDRLSRIRFPVGGMKKENVRERARELGLAVADKPDSQEVCFIPDGDTTGFLARSLGLKPGRIVDGSGRELGEHGGLYRFTIGQRRGLGISGGGPFHVIALDSETNTVVVGKEEALYSSGCRVEAMNVLASSWPASGVTVKIRSRHEATPCSLEWLGAGVGRIGFDSPQRSVTPGQAAVFYAGEEVLGGGVIAAADGPTASADAPIAGA